jgi:hypothetical protein
MFRSDLVRRPTQARKKGRPGLQIPTLPLDQARFIPTKVAALLQVYLVDRTRPKKSAPFRRIVLGAICIAKE